MPRLLTSTGRNPRRRIVIVGANFASLTVAQHLGQEYAVTVIDRSASFGWLPNIHELLSGVKRPAAAAYHPAVPGPPLMAASTRPATARAPERRVHPW